MTKSAGLALKNLILVPNPTGQLVPRCRCQYNLLPPPTIRRKRKKYYLLATRQILYDTGPNDPSRELLSFMFGALFDHDQS